MAVCPERGRGAPTGEGHLGRSGSHVTAAAAPLRRPRRVVDPQCGFAGVGDDYSVAGATHSGRESSDRVSKKEITDVANLTTGPLLHSLVDGWR